ncbi:unnamed protein product, partial [Dibothriocephalus latus]
MKSFIETLGEGIRSTAVLECLDDQVLIVATAFNISSSLATATIFERLRREFGVSSTPWAARRSLRVRRQLTGESAGEYQSHDRVLASKAYPDASYVDLESKILDIFIEGEISPDVRRQFVRTPPASIKLAIEYARQEESAFIAMPQREVTPSMNFGPR